MNDNKSAFIDYACSCGKRHKIETTVVFGNLETELKRILRPLGVKNVVLICSDSEYTSFGRDIKASLEKCKYDVEAITVESVFCQKTNVLRDLFAFNNKIAAICLSDGEVKDAVRYFAEKSNCPFISAPLSPNLYREFVDYVDLTFDGVLRRVTCRRADYLIIDKAKIFVCKKQLFADAFRTVVSKSLSRLEYIFGEQENDCKEALGVFTGALVSLYRANSDNLPKTVFNAQLLLAVALGIDNSFDDYALENAARILKFTDNRFSISQVEYYLLFRLTAIYKLYFDSDLTLAFNVANYGSFIEKLSALTCENELVFFNKLPKTIINDDFVVKQKHKYKKFALSELSAVLSLRAKFDSDLVKLCNIKTAKVGFLAGKVKDAILFAPYACEYRTVLSAMRDSGLLDCFASNDL